MARAKRKSDEVYNARRRAARALAKLERQAAQGAFKTEGQKRAVSSLAQQLETAISKSYANRSTRKYSKDISTTVSNLRSTANVIQSDRTQGATYRQNKIFERNLNNATMKDDFSSISKTEAKVFYRLTQNIWQGKPSEMRNELIRAHYGTESLEDAFNAVMGTEQAQNALEQANANGQPIGVTDENEAFYNDTTDTGEDFGSPDYIKTTAPLAV